MPLKLKVGVSKKIGQSDYGSLAASCHVELELDQGLLRADMTGFHDRVQKTFTACRQAVNDELARSQSIEGQEPQQLSASGSGGRQTGGNGRPNGRRLGNGH